MKSADRHRELREVMGLTQIEYALWLGISEATVVRWESIEPLFKSVHREKLSSVGINPAFVEYDHGDILQPGFNIVEIRKKLKAEVSII